MVSKYLDIMILYICIVQYFAIDIVIMYEGREGQSLGASTEKYSRAMC